MNEWIARARQWTSDNFILALVIAVLVLLAVIGIARL